MTNNQNPLTTQPSLFIAHGAPDLLISDIPARSFLNDLGSRLSKPRGIVVISAHWTSADLQMTDVSAQQTIHDFHGFPAELYDIEYKASGDNWLNESLSSALGEAGYPVRTGSRLGLDHGAWVPLQLMYPKADIPVIQLSLLESEIPEEHFKIGQALTGLREQGILILASGGLVHNLGALKSEGLPPDEWALSFDNGLFEHLQSRDLHALFNYATDSEHAKMAHPTDEHLMPLFVAIGAGWSEGVTKKIHHSFSYGNLSMTSYAFTESNI